MQNFRSDILWESYLGYLLTDDRLKGNKIIERLHIYFICDIWFMIHQWSHKISIIYFLFSGLH